MQTPSLVLTNEGEITAENEGPGNAGSLVIDADDIEVSSSSRIIASTNGGDGGNITLNARTILLLDSSTINASVIGEGAGGNVDISSDGVALVGSSDIAANAVQGSGGQVQIQSNTLFQSPDSAITATSEAGPALDGSVEITVQEESLRTEEQISPPLDTPSPVVACTRASEEGFAFVGRGGLPLSRETLGRSWEGWNTPSGTASLSEANQDGQIIRSARLPSKWRWDCSLCRPSDSHRCDHRSRCDLRRQAASLESKLIANFKIYSLLLKAVASCSYFCEWHSVVDPS